jgi:hypothetical protein
MVIFVEADGAIFLLLFQEDQFETELFSKTSFSRELSLVEVLIFPTYMLHEPLFSLTYIKALIVHESMIKVHEYAFSDIWL